MIRKRRARLPVIVASAFVTSLLILFAGIHQTAHLSSKASRHDVSFDPPVVARYGRRLNTSNTSLPKNESAGQAERRAREAALQQQQQHEDEPPPPLKDNDSPDLPSNLTDKGENATVKDLRPTTFPFHPQVQYLGVLIDAGRHYFPMDWLKDLVDTLARMHYNFIHFRLTDDQAFNINLTSHPELAKPSPVNNIEGKVYSVEELTDFVAYAAERKITVMPEINIPGHAGAWQGIPNFLVPCPEFICLKGYGIPLNISHPQMLPTIQNVIQEVREIFDTSPYLHLGGDEVEMSQACFNEANTPMFNYTDFEAKLEKLLIGMNVSLDKVLRWEMTPLRRGQHHQVQASDRAGKMTHYWVGHDYKKVTPETAKPFFVSQGLYFDSNKGETGWSIYSTAKLQASLQNKPVAIIGGTFELSTKTWTDRNVLGRLLAVAMGAARLEYNGTAAFEKDFQKYCNSVGLDGRGCATLGMPISPQQTYLEKWNQDWNVWKGDICERLTVEHLEPIMNPQATMKKQTLAQASSEFWNSFGLVHPAHSLVEVVTDNGKSSIASLPELAVDHLGLVVDLMQGRTAHHPQQGVAILKGVIDDMAKLGFNLLQLRIMSDSGMAVKLYSLPNLAFLTEGHGIWAPETMRQVVEYASTKGVQVMPEISITTRAGGWANAGILAECPNVICKYGQGIAIDTRESADMQIFALVLRELRGLFSSDYLHLGYDERKEAMKCYKEAKMDNVNLDEWEQRIEAVLRLEGIPEEKVLRWENTEQVMYPRRAGRVTNYRKVSSIKNSTASFFVTIDSCVSASAWDIYLNTREITVASPTGIMASIDVLGDVWDSLKIRERLLTVAMGARNMKLSGKVRFELAFKEACTALGLKNCESYVSNAADVAVSHKLDTKTKDKLRTDKLCEARTTKKSVKKPRKGVLIEATE